MATATQIQESQVGFAPVLEPYAQDLLASVAGLTDINENPYMQYMGDRFAQFSPLQQQAFTGIQGMQTAPQLDVASQLTQQAAQSAGGYGSYNPLDYQAISFTSPGMADQYMNPYMGAIQQQLQRQADTQRQTLSAQAAKSGAFGGARSDLMNSQLNAELMRQQQQAQAQAFGQAQQQFNTEQGARQQAAGMGEASRQFGVGLGLQGLTTALQGANQLGALGQTQFGQQMGINQLQQQYGTQQQQQMQNILSQQYQDFLNAQNYPYKQLGFMSDVLRGVPLTQTGTTVYQAPPSTAQTLTSLGLGAAGMSKLFKKGGAVKSEPRGLAALALSKI